MKESNGALKFQLYGSMQLGGKPGDLYNQTKNGVVDIGWVLPGYTAGLFPRLGVFELPFIGDDADIVAPAIDDYVRRWGKKEWGAVHVIVAHTGGPSVLHTKKKPIVSLADFKGMKIRTPSRISTKALTVLGATIVSIAAKIGCSAPTLHEWAKKADPDRGRKAAISADVAERLKALERENKELRQANEILRKASAYFAMAELDRRFKP